MFHRAAVLALASCLLPACGSDGGSQPPLFPADYASSYQPVRACMSSLEHDNMNVIVYASADAVTPYTGRMAAYPAGAILLKEEYDVDDTMCTGPVIFETAIQRLASGSSSATLDWHWQKVDAKRHVIMDDDQSCISCHTSCGQASAGGYMGTCSMP